MELLVVKVISMRALGYLLVDSLLIALSDINLLAEPDEVFNL